MKLAQLNESNLVAQELAHLKSLGYSWTSYDLVEVPLSALIVIEDGEKLPDYADSYRDGVELPPIAINDKNEIVDGNRRYQSALAANLQSIKAMRLHNFSFWRSRLSFEI